MKIIVISILVLAVFIMLMLLFLFIGKKKKFPETHISKNEEMKKKGISCAQHESMGCNPTDTSDCGCCSTGNQFKK